MPDINESFEKLKKLENPLEKVKNIEKSSGITEEFTNNLNKKIDLLQVRINSINEISSEIQTIKKEIAEQNDSIRKLNVTYEKLIQKINTTSDTKGEIDIYSYNIKIKELNEEIAELRNKIVEKSRVLESSNEYLENYISKKLKYYSEIPDLEDLALSELIQFLQDCTSLYNLAKELNSETDSEILKFLDSINFYIRRKEDIEQLNIDLVSEIYFIDFYQGYSKKQIPEIVVEKLQNAFKTLCQARKEGMFKKHKIVESVEDGTNFLKKKTKALIEKIRTLLTTHYQRKYDGLDEESKAREGAKLRMRINAAKQKTEYNELEVLRILDEWENMIENAQNVGPEDQISFDALLKTIEKFFKKMNFYLDNFEMFRELNEYVPAIVKEIWDKTKKRYSSTISILLSFILEFKDNLDEFKAIIRLIPDLNEYISEDINFLDGLEIDVNDIDQDIVDIFYAFANILYHIRVYLDDIWIEEEYSTKTKTFKTNEVIAILSEVGKRMLSIWGAQHNRRLNEAIKENSETLVRQFLEMKAVPLITNPRPNSRAFYHYLDVDIYCPVCGYIHTVEKFLRWKKTNITMGFLIFKLFINIAFIAPIVCDVIDSIKNKDWHRINSRIFNPWGPQFEHFIMYEVYEITKDINALKDKKVNINKVIEQMKSDFSLKDIENMRDNFYNTSIAKKFKEDPEGYFRHKKCFPFIYRRIKFPEEKIKKIFLKDIKSNITLKKIIEKNLYVRDDEEEPPDDTYNYHFLFKSNQEVMDDNQLDEKIYNLGGEIKGRNRYPKNSPPLSP